MDKNPPGEALEERVDALIHKNDFYRSRLDTFVSLYDAMVEGVAIHEIVYGPEGRAADYKIIDINKAFEAITAISRKEAMGKLATHLYHTAEAPYLALYERVARTGRPASFDTYFPPMDKHFSISVISPGKGLFATIFFDITERKKMEAALKESEGRFRSIVENTEAGYFFIDREGVIQDVNRSWAKMYRYDTPEEVIGRHFTRIQKTEDVEKAKAFVTGIMGGDSRLFSGEFSRQCHDGSVGYHTFSARPVVRLGEVIGIEGFIIDITDRKAAENALREREHDLSEAQRIAQVGNFRLAAVSERVSGSDELFRIFGLTRSQDTLNDFIDAAHPEDQEDIRRHVREVFKRGVPFDMEFRVVMKDREERTIHAIGRPVMDSKGGYREIVGTVQEITERKKLESQLFQARKMEAVGTLAGGIAHDFNNIISIVLGNAEICLEETPQESPIYGNLDEIRIASLRAKEVVKQLLSFSRHTEQKKKPIHLSDIVKESLSLLRASIPATVHIRQAIPDGLSPMMADPIQMHQVMLNLCTNAAQAMEEKGGVMDISLSAVVLHRDVSTDLYRLSPGNYLKLTVTDTGHGIDPRIRGRIFDPYFTTRPVGKGSGMGLSIVHGIVKSHGGGVFVYSEPGNGTSVKVYFPGIDSHQEKKNRQQESLPTGNERILFVDDEPAIVAVGKKMLERLGYQVTPITDPEAALALFKEKSDAFDLVITDMTMPKLTGDRLAREILALSPKTPVMLTTGFSDRIDSEKALQMGIRKYVEKPLNKEELAVAVRWAIDSRGSSSGESHVE
jgi:PAS domain S-box-containing protein